MVRHTWAPWRCAFLPLGTLLLVGCDAVAPSEHGEAPSIEHSAPALLDLRETAGPILRRIETEEIRPTQYPNELPAQSLGSPEIATAPLSGTDHLAPIDQPFDPGPELAMPMSSAGVPRPWTPPPALAIGDQRTLDSQVEPMSAPEMRALPLPQPMADDEVAVSETGTELPWARSYPRTPEMDAVVQRADEAVRRGFALAQRNALYSARAEFIQALRLIGEAFDAQQNTTLYTKALSAGLLALKESEEFVARGSQVPSDLDVAYLVVGHRTPILKGDGTQGLSPLAAVQRYYSYAQEQLGAAAAAEPVGSMALYGLGRVEMTLAESRSNRVEAAGRAAVCYQAALFADANNVRAANELGVLLVQSGRLEPARELFLRCVTAAPHAATWHNLAVVHERLGQTELAAQARAQAAALDRGGPRIAQRAKVDWVNPTDFARTVSPTDGLSLPQAPASQTPAPDPPPVGEKKGMAQWLPWSKPAKW